MTTAEARRIKDLEQEKPGAAPSERDPQASFEFLRGGARPPTQVIVQFIDANREDFGVEPICTVLQVAPSTYYEAKSRPPSPRAVRDAELKDELMQLWKDNYCVYGVRKLHKAARRAGHQLGRDQTARSMRSLGIAGARRDKKVRTTKADENAARHPDLVSRRFAAERPNQLWVTDLTYVATWAGMVYVCFRLVFEFEVLDGDAYGLCETAAAGTGPHLHLWPTGPRTINCIGTPTEVCDRLRQAFEQRSKAIAARGERLEAARSAADEVAGKLRRLLMTVEGPGPAGHSAEA